MKRSEIQDLKFDFRKIADQNIVESFKWYFVGTAENGKRKIKNYLTNDYKNIIDNHTHFMKQAFNKPYPKYKRLRWSRGSALPLSIQVRGFKPGRNSQDFQGPKILSAPSFGGEVKPSVLCRRFTACKRCLNVAWKSIFRQNYRTIYSPTKIPPFAAWISRGECKWR